VGAALSAALTGPVGAGVYAGQFALGGAALGLLLRAGRPPEAAVGAFAALLVAGFWFVLGTLALQAGKNPLDFVAETVRQSAEQARELLARGNGEAEGTAALRQWADQTAATMLRVFPGLLASFGVLAGWANALGLRRVLRGRGEDLAAWNTWRAPESWIWVLIGSGLVAALGPGAVGTTGLNVFVPTVVVYFLQGLAVIDHLFQARGFPRPLRALTYALLFLQLPIALFVAAVGAFDLWADFRARWSPPPPTKSIET
jgi:uncharacterized protein YybS (DUF2232 family)